MTGRIEQLAREYLINVRWRAFPLHPDTPEEGLLIEQLFAGYPVNLEAVRDRLRETAAGLGLPFGERDKTYNSRLAQELGHWAASKGAGEAFHGEVFRAYFAEGKNIAQVPVLVNLAAAVGLPREEAQAVLTTRAFRKSVDADWVLSRVKGITAVPTFVINDDALVGAQPYGELQGFAETQGVKKRSI
ncbi:MAG: DsbA family protein [Deltaproteobacteria bacterium]|nr:DsbA family protein [Deltaproteobacteria bacterium]